MINKTDNTQRRLRGADTEEDYRAGNNGAEHSVSAYQGSVQPMRRPDHKAKKHSRPADWTQRQDRKARQAREYAA